MNLTKSSRILLLCWPTLSSEETPVNLESLGFHAPISCQNGNCKKKLKLRIMNLCLSGTVGNQSFILPGPLA